MDDKQQLSFDADAVRSSENYKTILIYCNIGSRNGELTIIADKFLKIAFTTKRSLCPLLTMNNILVPTRTEVKYLCLHLDANLTWRAHISAKRRQFELKVNTYLINN